ncbi:MAG: glycosyltransferase family 2 protein [Acidobacteria bacterium]|nr:glycosyltransferase family 2 protein [Acidobacteriota bacterium]
MTTPSSTPSLSLVLPVYNEAELLPAVVAEWLLALDDVGVACELLIYDDGSTDATPLVLETLAQQHPRLVVRRHANRGHGPTILRGYREARGEWILQADSDGEIDVRSLSAFWNARARADFVIGRRVDRSSPWVRRLITGVSSLSVRWLFGAGVHDVNCPFRLMRASQLAPLLAVVPDDTFAPNVALSGLAVTRGLRVVELPVATSTRRRGGGSLAGLRALRAAARSWIQTSRIARHRRP